MTAQSEVTLFFKNNFALVLLNLYNAFYFAQTMYQVLYCPQTIHLSPIFIDYEQASLIIDYKGETKCDIRETSKVTL